MTLPKRGDKALRTHWYSSPSRARGAPIECHDELTAMTYADGYVMARVKGCAPFIATLADWQRYRAAWLARQKAVTVEKQKD